MKSGIGDELHRKGFVSQKQSGYLTLKTQYAGGKISARELSVMQEAADKFGNGELFINMRQGIELPFVAEEKADEAEEFLVARGIKTAAVGKFVLAPVACKGNAVCRSAVIDTSGLAEEFTRRYGGLQMPAKFMTGIAGCPNDCVKVARNDLGIIGTMKPEWNASSCVYCRRCMRVCRPGAIQMEKKLMNFEIDADSCKKCGKCVNVCPVGALSGRLQYKLVFSQNDKPVLFVDGVDAEKLFPLLDRILGFYRENAEIRERLGSFLLRLDEKSRKQLFEKVLS